MTYSGDFSTAPGAQEAEAKSGLNPALIGGIIGVVGLLGAAYIGFTQVKPAWDQNQQLKLDLEAKKVQSQQTAQIAQERAQAEANRAAAAEQRAAVASLFADEQTLDTLLLDFNREVQKRQAVELTRFQPTTETPQVISDASLGPQVSGKLRGKEYQIELKGSFDQTRLVLLAMERLQPLLVVKDFRTQVDPSSQEVVYRQGRLISRGTPQLTTTMTVQALLPNPTAPPPTPAPAASPAPTP